MKVNFENLFILMLVIIIIGLGIYLTVALIKNNKNSNPPVQKTVNNSQGLSSSQIDNIVSVLNQAQK